MRIQSHARDKIAPMDWTAIRRLLATYRRRASLSAPALASKTGISRATVYRIEDVAHRPTHELELDTLETWIVATGGTLSGFFAELNALPASIEGTIKSASPPTQPPPTEVSHAGRPVSVVAEELASAFLDISNCFTVAAARLREAYRTFAETHPSEAGSRLHGVRDARPLPDQSEPLSRRRRKARR